MADDIDEELEVAIKRLSPNQLMALAKKYTRYDIDNYFKQVKEDIAIQLKTRIQSKIALSFTSGYSTGRLFDSIYYRIEGNSIIVKSTANYFSILNRGFDSFDMKDALLKSGRPIPIRLPGGRVIFRWPGQTSGRRLNEFNEDDLANVNKLFRNRRFMTKKGTIRKYYGTKNWIHPGYQGKHIFEQVKREMEPWIKEHVRERVWALLHTIPDVPFSSTPEGHIYYSKRDTRGRFV